MATEPVELDEQVWAIDGVKTDASAARAEAYRSTKGARGITLPTDMQVRALGTPGGAVQVMPGGCTTPNDYVTNSGQSYGRYSDKTIQVAVPATDSTAGATRYVVWGVNDPQYPGVQTAWSGCTLEPDLDAIDYPHVPLARIDQPNSTAAIDQSYITDLRRVANPQKDENLIYRAAVTSDTGLVLNKVGAPGEYFPNIGDTDLEIPEWATRVLIKATWGSVKYTSGNTWGSYWVEYGPYDGPSQRKYSTQHWGFNSTGSTNDVRVNWVLFSDQHVPAAIRGTTQKFVFKAKYAAESTNKGVEMTNVSGVGMEVVFLERADPSIEAIN